MSRFLTEEQKLMQNIAREFAQTEVRARAMEIDKANEFPRDLHKRCGELGFLGVMLPEKFGGLDAGLTMAAVICEEISKESPAFGISLFVSMAAPTYFLEAPALADKYLKSVVAGDKVCSAALTFPVGSTNFTEWGVFGKKDGNDWILNGTKLYVTNTRAADIVMAIGFTEDYKVGMWILEKGHPGLQDNHVERKMGANGNNSGTYVFSNCKVSGSQYFEKHIGGVGFGNALCASVALGCAQGAYAKTMDFVKVRTRAHKPLATKQVVAHHFATMYGQIESSRSLLYDATRLADEGREAEAKILINTSKAMITEMAVDVTRKCVQLHGGMGYCEDTGIARYMRDAMGTTIADCPSDLHRETIAHLLGFPEAERCC